MAINAARIRAKVKRAIALRPATITITRVKYKSNGYNGKIKDGVEEILTTDVFIDDMDTCKQNNFMFTEAGKIENFNRIFMYAVIDPVKDEEAQTPTIEIDDYFFTNNRKYKILNNLQIVEGIYCCELEVVKS